MPRLRLPLLLLTCVLVVAVEPLAVDRARVRPQPVTASLLWSDGEEAWLPLPPGLAELQGDLDLQLAGGWATTWGEGSVGDCALTLRCDGVRVALLVRVWSETWRGNHLGLLRSVARVGEEWQIAVDIEREFPEDAYNPQRVLEVVPGAHLVLRLRRDGEAFAGTWQLRQGGYRSGVYGASGTATGTLRPQWPVQDAAATWPHAGPRPRLGTLALPAVELPMVQEELRRIWDHHDWRPHDPAVAEADEAQRDDAYHEADMELRRLWDLPLDGPLLAEVQRSAALIDRAWPLLDGTWRSWCRTWLERNAEWAYVRSLEFPADAPWAGQLLGVAACCLCVVHGERGELQRQSFTSRLVAKMPIILPPSGAVALDEAVPLVGIPLGHSITDWLIAGPWPGRHLEDLFGERAATLRLHQGGTLELLGQACVLRRTGPEHLLAGVATPVLDVGRLVDERRDHTVVLYTVIDAPVRGLVSCSFKLPGVGAWLSGVPVADDQTVRLEAGRHPLLLQCPIGPVVGPGQRRFPAELKLVPQPDQERHHEPFRQYLERGQLLPGPYWFAPRIEAGLRRWLAEALGVAGTWRAWEQDEDLLQESLPELPLRAVLPALGAWRRTFGRDLVVSPALQALPQAYAQHCLALGRPADADLLLGLQLAGLAVPELPPVDGVTALGSAPGPAWRACFPPLVATVPPVHGLRADPDTGVVFHTTPEVQLHCDAVHDPGLASPAHAAHVTLRAWGRGLLVAAPPRRPWLGRVARGDMPLPQDVQVFLGGHLVEAMATETGCRFTVERELRAPLPAGGWQTTARTVGFLEGVAVDGRDRWRPEAFALSGRSTRACELQHDGDRVTLQVQDRCERIVVSGDSGEPVELPTPPLLVLHSELGPWRETATGWAAADGGVHMTLELPDALSVASDLPVPEGLHRLVLSLPAEATWILRATREAQP